MRARILCALGVAAACLAFAAPVQADYVSVVAADSPFMWYRMQETNPADGSAAADSGSLGGTAASTYAGTVANLPAGMVPAVSPAKDYNVGKIVVSSPNAPSAATNYTVEFLIKPTTREPEFQTIFCTTDWGVGDLDVNLYGHDGIYELQLATAEGGHPWGRTDVTSLMPLNEWSHVALTYEGTEGAGGTSKYYVNGELVNTYATGYYPIDFSQAINIAANPLHGRYYLGGLDEVAVYSTTLTGDQVQTHYNALVPEPGTVALLVTGLLGLLAYAWRKRK